MEIETYQLPSSQPLTEAYVNRTDNRLKEILGSHPGEQASWQARAQWLDSSRADRVRSADLADVLQAYNARFNATEAVASGIAAIAQGAPVIVGGQQAGLWSGPLLVIHKTVTVIQAAKEASELIGKQVIPVFWIAGEDHDWDEANHAYVIPDQAGLKKIAVNRPSAVRTSVSRTELPRETMQAALDELAAALPDSPHKQELLAVLSGCMEQSSTLSDWFAHLISRMFGEYGLVLIDADDPAVRKLEGPMFRRMIERNDELEEAYLRGAAAVRGLGYKEQAEAAAGCANLFVFQSDEEGTAGERTLLHKRKGRFENRKGNFGISREELLQLADRSPERLSNNVLTRPLMQDYVLPVLGAVLGAGEIAYWAITADAFAAFGMQMPILIPRMSFTIVEPQIAHQLSKYELSFDDVVHRFEDRKRAWLDERDELQISLQFEEARQKFVQLYEPLLAMAAEVQTGLSELGDKNKNRILDQITYMETRTKEAHDKRFDAAVHQLDRIAAALWPNGQPQERTLNVLHYWNQYGSRWFAPLLEIPYDRLGNHRIVYL